MFPRKLAVGPVLGELGLFIFADMRMGRSCHLRHGDASLRHAATEYLLPCWPLHFRRRHLPPCVRLSFLHVIRTAVFACFRIFVFADGFCRNLFECQRSYTNPRPHYLLRHTDALTFAHLVYAAVLGASGS